MQYILDLRCTEFRFGLFVVGNSYILIVVPKAKRNWMAKPGLLKRGPILCNFWISSCKKKWWIIDKLLKIGSRFYLKVNLVWPFNLFCNFALENAIRMSKSFVIWEFKLLVKVASDKASRLNTPCDAGVRRWLHADTRRLQRKQVLLSRRGRAQTIFANSSSDTRW